MTYNFRNDFTFETRNVKSVYCGSETISFLGPKIWGLLTLQVHKILTSSNQILNFESLKTVHAVCEGYILQTYGLFNYNFISKYKFCFSCCSFLPVYVYMGMFVCVYVCIYVYVFVHMRICVYVFMYACRYVYVFTHTFMYICIYKPFLHPVVRNLKLYWKVSFEAFILQGLYLTFLVFLA